MINEFTVHCRDCARMFNRDLTGLRPSEVRCSHCESDRVAIWKDGHCLYSFTGAVWHPLGKTKFGEKAPGKK